MDAHTSDRGTDEPRHGDAYEFFFSHQHAASDLGISANTTDTELAALADIETRMAAEQDPPQIVTGIYEYLIEVRDAIRNGTI